MSRLYHHLESATIRYTRRTQTLALHWLTEHGHDKCALLTRSEQLFDQSPADIVARYKARGGMDTDIHEDKVGFQELHG